MQRGELDHEIFFSPSPPREEKGPGDEEVGAGYGWQAPDNFSKHLRRASTPAEYLMWQLVRNRQCCQAKFRRQHKLGPYVLDFFCPEARLVIECDGLPHFTQEGIEVIRFTSHEIENETQRVLFAIDEVLKRLLKQDTPPHPPTPSPPEEEKGS